MKNFKCALIGWIVLMFMLTFTCLLGYLITQQALRLDANELPAALAIQTSLDLSHHRNTKIMLPTVPVDISKSLSPFVMIYDRKINLVATTALIHNQKPLYPKEILKALSQQNEIRVTWQPKPNLRFASVAMKYQNGYIVSGRSLLETEKLINQIEKIVIAAWFAGALFSGVMFFILCLLGL